MENQLVPFKVPELELLDRSKAANIIKAFTPMAISLSDLDEEYKQILSEEEITSELSERARNLRLAMVPIRTSTSRAKDEQKKSIKLEDKAIMSVHNLIVDNLKEREAKMKSIEDHLANLEKERKAKLSEERAEILEPYKQFAALGMDLGSLSEDDFNIVLNGAKLQFEAAEKQKEEEAKALQIEHEKIELSNARQKVLRPYYAFLHEDLDLKEMSEEDFQSKLSELKSEKEAYDLEQEKIREENEALRKAELKKQRVRDLRGEEMKPYIIFIREYEKMINLVEDEYQIELAKVKKEFEDDQKQKLIEKEKQDKIAAELQAKKDKEAEELRLAEEKKQAELSKGDAEKVKDLKSDLLALKTKYDFESTKNQEMYSKVGVLLDKIIGFIK